MLESKLIPVSTETQSTWELVDETTNFLFVEPLREMTNDNVSKWSIPWVQQQCVIKTLLNSRQP